MTRLEEWVDEDPDEVALVEMCNVHDDRRTNEPEFTIDSRLSSPEHEYSTEDPAAVKKTTQR